MEASKLYTLSANDVIRSIAVAVVVAVLGGVQQAISMHGFDVAAWDWGLIVNLALSALAGHLGINFLSDEDKKIVIPLGKAKIRIG